MKILLAVHHFPPHFTGGAELQAYQTASALIKRGHQVRVVCIESIDSVPNGRLAWSDEIYDGIPVRRLRFHLEQAPDPFRWSYDNPWINSHLLQLMQDDRPDLFHLISGYLIGAGPLKVAADEGIPTVVTLMDFWFICPRITLLRSDGGLSSPPIDPSRCAQCLAEEKRRYRLPGRMAPGLARTYWTRQQQATERIVERRSFLLEALGAASAVISHSSFLRSVFIQEGIDPTKIIATRQGKDFPGLEEKHFEKEESAKLRLGYLGQIAPHKGVHVLVEALKHLPGLPIEAVIYGDTSRFPEYTRQLETAMADDDRIRFGGLFKPDELSSVMQSLDLVVVPSLWYENSPNVILEAFGHRTPVAASRLGGMTELLGDGAHGLLFQPGDAEDLARSLKRVVSTPRFLEQLRSSVPEVKTVAEETEELELVYQSVVSGSFTISDLPDEGTGLAPGLPASSA